MRQCEANAYNGGQRCNAAADESGRCWRHRDRTLTEADRQAELRNAALSQLLTLVRLVRKDRVAAADVLAALAPLHRGGRHG